MPTLLYRFSANPGACIVILVTGKPQPVLFATKTDGLRANYDYANEA